MTEEEETMICDIIGTTIIDGEETVVYRNKENGKTYIPEKDFMECEQVGQGVSNE